MTDSHFTAFELAQGRGDSPTGETIAERLEELRAEIRAERISYSEPAELAGLAEHIPAGDVELLEWAGVPEFPEPAPRLSYGWCEEHQTLTPHYGDSVRS